MLFDEVWLKIYLMFKHQNKFLVLISFLTLFSCQDILECVINVRPDLPNKSLSLAQTDSYYFDSIKAEVKNDPHDDGYDYYFSVYGDFPEGLEYYIDYRTLVIEGFPEEEGSFNFTIQVTVEAYEDYYYDDDGNLIDNDNLCTDTTQKDYTIRVQ